MIMIFVLVILSILAVMISADSSFGNPFTNNYIPGEDNSHLQSVAVIELFLFRS